MNPEETWRLYSALAAAAGVSRPVRVADPRILVGRVRQSEGELAVFVNCSDAGITVTPITDNHSSESYSPDPFTLAAFGVAIASRESVRRVPSEEVDDAEVSLATAEGSDAFGAR